MGRNAAGESFLRGLIQHGSSKAIGAVVASPEHASGFSKTVQRYQPELGVQIFHEDKLSEPSSPDIIFYPGPDLGKHAYQRSIFGSASWSLCGITHTTSSAGAMDALVNLVTGPLKHWDAVICPSHSVKENAVRVIEAQKEYLKNKLGATKFELPQLPVIPLGIHTEDFNFTDSQRASFRSSIGADSESIVVTYMGRLSFHAKAHPLAMYQALSLAAEKTQKKIILVECGWHANEYIKASFEEAAKAICPTVRHLHLDGRDRRNRDTAWASADIFCSFSDNIQETFGIVPIEAMAASVPSVVSDWNGYKDSVREGVDGFRIPTMMPGPNSGPDLALRHAIGKDTYDMYCGLTSSMISVDIISAADAFTRLIESPELRAQMGAAGKKRAEQIYDWSVIIPSYEALWSELNDRRTKEVGLVEKIKNSWPARLDPFYAFEHYASSLLKIDTTLALVDVDAKQAMLRYRSYLKLKMVNYNTYLMPEEAVVFSIFNSLNDGPLKAAEILIRVDARGNGFVFRYFAALLKLGLVKIQK